MSSMCPLHGLICKNANIHALSLLELDSIKVARKMQMRKQIGPRHTPTSVALSLSRTTLSLSRNTPHLHRLHLGSSASDRASTTTSTASSPIECTSVAGAQTMPWKETKQVKESKQAK